MNTDTSIAINVPVPKATRHEWIGLAVIALPCLLYSMDLNMLTLAIPYLTADLRPSASQLLWIVDIYGFLLAGFLITMGTLGDRIGRRRLLMIGAGAFAAASVLAAFSTSTEMLIFSRAVLGIAGATVAPSTLSLIRNMFLDPEQRTMAIGIWAGCFASGIALGPVIGGVMVGHFWWGSVFLLAVPAMVLLLILAPMLLPDFRDPSAGALDIPSSMLATGTVLTMVYGMKRLAEHGLGAQATTAVIASLIIGALFVYRQKRLTHPLIDLQLFSSPLFAAALAVNIIGVFAASGLFLFIGQYMQLVLGMGPLEAGLWIAPTGIVFVAGSLLAPIIVRRFEARTVLALGFSVAVIGFGLLTQVRVDGQLWVLLAGLILLCVGLAPLGTLTTDILMSSVPPEKAGVASGVSETSLEFGAAFGIAVLGSIVTAVYRTSISNAGLQGIPPHAFAAARDTLGAAVATAQALPGEPGLALLHAAREAFTQSFQATALVGSLLAVAAAVVCTKFMKRAAVATP
jgi:MFS transporter, DHA2 family, multidrug resistance protein